MKGCGYPPNIKCSLFEEKFGVVGTQFTCYHSKIDPDLVITRHNQTHIDQVDLPPVDLVDHVTPVEFVDHVTCDPCRSTPT